MSEQTIDYRLPDGAIAQWTPEQISAHIRSLHIVTTDALPQDRPAYGLFVLHFDNRRKQLRGYSSYERWGTVYPDNKVHVHLDDLQLQRDFNSLREMIAYFTSFGDCAMTWEGVAENGRKWQPDA